jgi:shikimate dehydrogenase
MQPCHFQTFKLGLIGYPVSHSLSPKIQSAALAACGLQGDYSLFPIHPDDKQGLKDLLARVRSCEITGLNVTIPQKQDVVPLLDELTPTAQVIGAVNVIYRRENKLIGENTDAVGFLTDLKKFLKGQGLAVKERSALVLGAGGSARSVVYALLHDGWQVTIAARRIEQAQVLAQQLNASDATEWNVQTFERLNVQLIVNTTPLGMSPNIDQSPVPGTIDLPKAISIYDLVYNPRETKLVRDARAQGLQATTGLGMLIEQAALGFELWTGHKPPLDVLWKAVEN